MASFRVYLDTDGLLDLVTPEGTPDRAHLAIVGKALADGTLRFVTSELTIVESLVHAVRSNNSSRESLLRGFLSPSAFLESRPVSLQVIEDALVLRVVHGFKTPDAIHIATGISASCDAYLTKDTKWARPGLRLLNVEELVGLCGDV